MLFSSTEFIFVFLPVFFLIYFAVKVDVLRNLLIVAASLFFYAWGEHVYVFLMIFSILFNWLCAVQIEKKQGQKAMLVFCVAVNLAILGYYKYADFLIGGINGMFGTGIPLVNIRSLPLGISFYTFQSLSYVVDVYRGTAPAQKNPLWLGEYIACFPQLIAGPIVRYTDIHTQLAKRTAKLSDVADGIRRFVIGLAKKVIIANTMASVCDSIFAGLPSQYGFMGAWIGLWTFGLQMFFDFAGYSDMAIGFGKMLGFTYPENFNYPFIAKSVADFWKRWHMTLTQFFRDYLYFPLGGNRVKLGRWIVNVMLVWSLTGLWHGASVNFILWGAFSGFMLIMERLWLAKWLEKRSNFAQHLYLLTFVSLNWVVMRFEQLPDIISVYKAMFFMSGAGSISYLVTRQVFQLRYIIVLLIAIFLCMPAAGKWLMRKYQTPGGAAFADVLLLGIFALTILTLIVSNYNPFIYFRF